MRVGKKGFNALQYRYGPIQVERERERERAREREREYRREKTR